MKLIGIIITALAVLFGVGVAFSIIGFVTGVISLPFHAAGNIVDTGHGVIDATLNADNAIYNYHWFIEQRESIVAVESKIRIAQDSLSAFTSAAGERSTWTFEDKTEAARLQSVKQGLQSQYESMVAEYNARSQEADRAIFKDGFIPAVLETSASLLL